MSSGHKEHQRPLNSLYILGVYPGLLLFHTEGGRDVVSEKSHFEKQILPIPLQLLSTVQLSAVHHSHKASGNVEISSSY